MRSLFHQRLCLALTTVLVLGLMGCQQESNNETVASNPQVCCGGEKHNQIQSAKIVSEDLGEIDQGEIVKRTLSVTNNGDDPALLNGTVESNYPCCVKVDFDAKELAPGAESDLLITIDTTLRPGPLDIFINLPFEGGDVAPTIHLGGLVREEFRVFPTGLKFADRESVEFEVSGAMFKEGRKITGFQNDIDGLSVNFLREEGGTHYYEATWDGSRETEQIQYFYILSDHPNVTEFPIAVSLPQTEA